MSEVAIEQPLLTKTPLWRCATVLSFAAVGPAVGAMVIAPLLVVHSDWLREHAAALALPLVIASALLCGLALVPTFVVTVALVWLYGLAAGLPMALIAYAVAAAIGWFVFRFVGQSGMDLLIERKPAIGVVRDALLGGAFWQTTWTVLLLRISPVVPFALINATAGIARARVDAFVLGTAIGLLPRGAIVGAWVYKLQSLSFDEPQNWPIFVGGIAVSIAVLILLGRKARAALNRSLQVPGAVV